jgi:hypothetical protein
MTNKQYRIPNVSIRTAKQSIAAIASRWFQRKDNPRRAGSGAWVARFTQRETVRSDMSKPSLSARLLFVAGSAAVSNRLMVFDAMAQLVIGLLQGIALLVRQVRIFQLGDNLVELSLKQFKFFAKHGDLPIMSAVCVTVCFS